MVELKITNIYIMPFSYKINNGESETVIIVNGCGIITNNDIEKFSAFFQSYLEGEKLKVFFDIRKVNPASVKSIPAMVTYMTTFEKEAMDKVIASSVLVKNNNAVNLIKLLFNIKEPAIPTIITTDIDKACSFLNDRYTVS